jgi:metallo-beta-lactamase family protein
MYQGPRQEADRINRWLAPDAPQADAVILSHGHLDHCGKLPELVRAGFKGKIYCTPATAEVARIVLQDSAMIQAENVDFLNRQGRPPGEPPPAPPIYTPQDVPPVLKLMQRVAYGQAVDLGKGVKFTFHDAGHILGSAYVVVEWGQRRLIFSGDVGRYSTPIIRDPETIAAPADYLITESTYGNSHHGPMSEVGPQFLDAVKFCIANKSRLLVPSFAVGRTQTVLWYMQQFIQNKQIPQIPVFVDSPMGVEVSKVYSEFRENYDQKTLDAIGKEDLFGLSLVTFASSVADSKKINTQPGPCVIIASSPTCEFGRILHHLQLSANRPNDVVVFVGYIPPNTLGRRLQSGQKHVRILDRWYDVKFQVRSLQGLSAHADVDELMRFLKPTLTKQTSAWVVHGEVDQAQPFAQRLTAAGIARATLPAMDTSLDIPD